MERRQALLFLAATTGAVLADGNEAASQAQPPAGPVNSAATAASAAAAGVQMEKVLGIGGLFFRATDASALARWYRDYLGVAPTPSDSVSLPWHTEAGTTVFTPFPRDTDYFGAMTQAWMVNFRVRDLDKMVAQLQSKGVAVKVDSETYPYGRFARLHDPEGNPIELWQPKARDATP